MRLTVGEISFGTSLLATLIGATVGGLLAARAGMRAQESMYRFQTRLRIITELIPDCEDYLFGFDVGGQGPFVRPQLPTRRLVSACSVLKGPELALAQSIDREWQPRGQDDQAKSMSARRSDRYPEAQLKGLLGSLETLRARVTEELQQRK